MVKLQINYFIGHYCTRWLHVVSTPVSIEEEASIEYLTPRIHCWLHVWKSTRPVKTLHHLFSNKNGC